MYQPVAYAYQAAFICPDCAARIMAARPEPDYPEPWDTDDWPCPVFSWEWSRAGEEVCDRMDDCINRETRLRRDSRGRFAGGTYFVGGAL